MSRTIEITIAPDGTSQVETKGFTGADCRDASRFVEQALGKHIDEMLKPEFHQAVSAEQQEIRQQ